MCRLLRLLVVPLFAVPLAGCPSPVALPDVTAVAGPADLPAVPPARGNPNLRHIPLDGLRYDSYRAGQRTDEGVRVSEGMARAFAAYERGDADAALTELDTLERDGPDAPTLWTLLRLRFDVLFMLGRAADAEAVADRVAAVERPLVGSDLPARALRAQARIDLQDFNGARKELAFVIHALGSWSLPISFTGPPTNLLEMRALATAQVRAYTDLGIVHFLEGDYQAAERWAAAAEGLFNDIYYVLSHPLYGSGTTRRDIGEGRAYNLAILGAARALAAGDEDGGVGQMEAALGFFRSIGHAHGLAVVGALRAKVRLSLGRYEGAIAAAEEAERTAAAAGLGDLLWWIAAERGAALLAYGRKDEAEAAFRTALAGIEAASGALATDLTKLRFGLGKEGVIRTLVRLDIERGNLAALFRDMETGRARAFVEMLRDRAVGRQRSNPTVAAIQDLDRRIRRQRLINAAPGGPTDGAARERKLMDERHRLLAELRRADPDLADTLAVYAPELPEVQARLAAGEVLVYAVPAELRERLRFLIVSRERGRLVDGAGTSADLDAALGMLASAVADRDGSRQKAALAAIERQVDPSAWGAGKTAYVVPSGPLHFVPWGALGLNHPVIVIPSAAWLLRPSPTFTKAARAVVVGDPDFRSAFPQLPGARREAFTVSGLYAGEPLIGAAATEDALRGRVGRGVDVLHLATHGFFDAVRPLDSAIVLSGGERPGLVTAARLFEEPLPARLVVLSACETGVGGATAGEDFLGLPRSLYLGGTRAVVSSLWAVEDEGTALFMETFHRAARDGDYGVAWLAARNRLRAGGYPPSVYGAFVLGGARQ